MHGPIVQIVFHVNIIRLNSTHRIMNILYCDMNIVQESNSPHVCVINIDLVWNWVGINKSRRKSGHGVDGSCLSGPSVCYCVSNVASSPCASYNNVHWATSASFSGPCDTSRLHATLGYMEDQNNCLARLTS